MKIAIMGSGGVGGYYGGRLAKAGEDVTFIARGPHLEAMRAKGLRVESVSGDFALESVQATDDPSTIGDVELVIVATKAYALREAAEAIRPLIAKNAKNNEGSGTAVLPLLNGVDIAEQLGAMVGMEPMLGGLCGISTFIAEPGVIKHVSPFEFLIFGEFSGEATPRVQAIERVFKGAHIDVTLTPEIEAKLWGKFIMLAAIAGVCSVTRQMMGPMRSDPETRAMLEDAVREIEAVGRKKGVALAPDAFQVTLGMVDGFMEDGKPSMLLDLEQGKPLELEALNGAVSRMGKELGVATPVNDFIYTALKLHADGAR